MATTTTESKKRGRPAKSVPAGAASAKTAVPPASKRGKASLAPEPLALTPGDKLTVDKLEAYLWAAAGILRGTVDAGDYKNYIFGLLFLKRVSDRYDERAEELRALGKSPRDSDLHDFHLPEVSRWSTIASCANGIGDALNKASSELETENPKALGGVLEGTNFTDEQRLGGPKARDAVLSRLVQHFSALNLRNDNLSEPDMLGRAYEFLIERFAEGAGKIGGEFYTPRGVVQLLVAILDPKAGMRICDPTCGSGGMLVECANYLSAHGQNKNNLTLEGQEKNLGTWAICKMNMLLRNMQSVTIAKGDTLRDPQLLADGKLKLYDRVIANPPFSLDNWGREEAEADRYGRFKYGIPPKTKGDLAFVQHMIATLKTDGMAGVVMPHGVLFRGAAEGEIRKGMLEDDLVEAIVGLPSNLFYGTGIPAAIVVLNRKKSAARKGKVLFIEASRAFGPGTNQNTLRAEDVAKIASTFHAFEDVPKYARVVALEEIAKNDFNLNISRYVETAEATEKVDVAAAIAKLRELEGKRSEAETRMNAFLKELGYDS